MLIAVRWMINDDGKLEIHRAVLCGRHFNFPYSHTCRHSFTQHERRLFVQLHALRYRSGWPNLKTTKNIWTDLKFGVLIHHNSGCVHKQRFTSV